MPSERHEEHATGSYISEDEASPHSSIFVASVDSGWSDEYDSDDIYDDDEEDGEAADQSREANVTHGGASSRRSTSSSASSSDDIARNVEHLGGSSTPRELGTGKQKATDDTDTMPYGSPESTKFSMD